MGTGFWFEFAILYGAALFGGIALIPYSLRLLKASGSAKRSRLSVANLLILSFLQTAIVFAIVIGLGLLVSRAIGLGAIEAAVMGGEPGRGVVSMLLPAVGLGILGGFVLLLTDILWRQRLPPALLDAARQSTLWENIGASFYGGLNEEFLFRLFGMSAVAWLLSSVWHTPSGLPTERVFWSANLVLAILFGLGHLPMTKGLIGRITPFIVARTLVLNVPIGLICGWLFWRFGIEAAVVAHFVADILYHVGGTVVLRLNDQHHFLP